MPKKADPKSTASKIRGLHAAGLDENQIAETLKTTRRHVQRVLWAQANGSRQRDYDRKYRSKRYRRDKDYRDKHIERVKRSQAVSRALEISSRGEDARQ